MNPAGTYENTATRYPGTITVRGTGKATVPPDVTEISLSVSTRRRDYAATLTRLNEKVERLRQAVESAGVDRAAVKTTNFDISVHRTERGKTWYDDGFEASHDVRIDLPMDNDLCNRVLHALADSRIAAQMRVRFRVSDPRILRRALLSDATRNARVDAEAMAAAAGCRLGRIRGIDYSWSEHRFGVYADMSMDRMASMAMPDLQPDDVEASDTVKVVWELVEEGSA